LALCPRLFTVHNCVVVNKKQGTMTTSQLFDVNIE